MPSKTKDTRLIYNAWLTTGKDPCLRGKWMSDEVWYRCIKRVFSNLETLGVTRQSMNKALGTMHSRENLFDPTVENGLFRCSFKVDDPFQEKDRNGKFKKRNTTFYYVQDPSDTPPELPVRGNPVHERLVRNFDARVRMAQQAQLQLLQNEESYSAASEMIEDAMKNMSIEQEEEEEDDVPAAAAPVLEQDYFDSPEAKKLFIGDKNSPKSVREVLEN